MEIRVSKEGLTKTGVILLLLSGLVFHDFFALKYVKLGVITITYLRAVLILTIPLLLFLYKVRIRKNDVFAYVFLIFMAYGLTRIEGNLKEAFALYCPIIAFFVLYFSIDDKKTMKKCIDLVALLFMMFCLLGIFELISGFHFVSTRFDLLEEKKQVACGMYYNENDFSAFLSVSMIFMLLSKYKKTLKAVFVVIAIIILFLNNSIICLLGIASFFLMVFIFRNKSNKFFRFVLVAALSFALIKPVNEIINSTSIWWRSYMYSFGIQNVLSHLWFGNGIGKYGEGMLSVGFDISKQGASTDPHNLFYELAGVFGIGWSILLILLLIGLLLRFLKMPKTRENVYSFGFVFIIPFIGLSSSSCMEKNYIYLALLIPLIQYRFYINRFRRNIECSLESDAVLLSEKSC